MADEVGKLKFLVEVDSERAVKSLEDFDKSIDDTESNVKQAEESTGKSFDGMSAKSVAMAVAIGSAVIKLGKEITQATSEIEEGQATIVKATGATGESLEGLMTSAKNVYASTEESFDDISRAIGEVNTRLGYTDKQLETTTGLFLDFADATGQDVQQSVIDVTRVMNQWNMDAEELPSLLDKLTYAGQASGVSVSQLTNDLMSNASMLQTMGYSMDESIAMMMQFETQGIDSNAVLMAMQKSFAESAQAGTDARADWDDLLDSITNATDQTEANSIAIDAFGNRISATMVQALQSGKLNWDEYTEAIANSNGVLETTDEASKTTADRIEELKHTVTLMLGEVGAELAPMVEELLPTVKSLLDAVFTAIKPLIPVIGDLVATLLPPVIDIIITLTEILVPIVEAILPPLKTLLTLVGGILSSLLTILQPLLGVLGDVLGVGLNLVASILNPMLSILTPIFELIANAINAVLTPLVNVLNTVVGWIDSLIQKIKKLIGWFGDWIKDALGLNDTLEDSADVIEEVAKKVEDGEKANKDYTDSIVDMSDAIADANNAFLDNVKASQESAQARYEVKTATEEVTEAVKEETEALQEESEQVEETAETYAEATEKEVEAEKEVKEQVEENTKANKQLADARNNEADKWIQKLYAQDVQTRQNIASELEGLGQIEQAYAIRATLIEEERQRELTALQQKVNNNEATEQDIANLNLYYDNLIEQSNKKKNDAIEKQNQKLAEEEQKQIEQTQKAYEELTNARQAEADKWVQKLVAQDIQTRQNTANELEGLGKIEEAYQIRSELIEEERNRELAVLEEKVKENKATEQDITNLMAFYDNQQVQNNKKKNDAIDKQNQKLAEETERLAKQKADAEKAQIEATQKAEEDARRAMEEAYTNYRKNIEEVMRVSSQSIASAIVNMANVMVSSLATAQDRAKALQGAVGSLMKTTGSMLSQLTEDLVSGEDAWKNLGKTALKALASILRALAEEMTARAVLALFTEQWGKGALLTAGAVAGYASAGLIDGYANSLAIGSDYVPYDDYPARLHRGEMVLNKVEAERLRNVGGMYGVEKIVSQPLSVATANGINSVNVNNQLSAVIEVDGTQLGIAVLKNIDNASQFVLR